MSDGVTIFSGSVEGSLFAFDAATGSERWATKLFEWGVVGPTLADGRLFAGAPQLFDVVAVDTTTGAEIWRAAVTAPSETPPVVSGGLVMHMTFGGTVYFLDATTGATYCTIELGDLLFAAPADDFGNVFTTSLSGVVAAFVPSTCSVAWFVKAGGGFIEPPIAQNGLVFAGSGLSGMLTAYDAVSGSVIWSYSNPASPEFPQFAIQGDMVFVAQGELIALSSATGGELWRFSGDAAVQSIPYRADNAVVVGDAGGTLYAIDLVTGLELWRLGTGVPSGASTAAG